MPDSFATADQAASYGYALPGASADGLLARATQAIRDAAGFSVLEEAAVVDVPADCGRLELPVPLVTSVTLVELLQDDGTRETVTGWRWEPKPDKVAGDLVHLPHGTPGRHCGTFAVSLTHGLASVPDSLVMLTGSVAYRLAATPVAMLAGVTSQSVGAVSWSASGSRVPGDELTGSECSRLAKIVPLKRVWQVPL